jgi:DNA topoisomerase-1
MSKQLIIVESPSKARTLAKFLGAGYTVKASMGHVRDLPKSKMGVDVDNDFAPQYEVIKGKEKQISELKAAAKQADVTLLAADPDREGEAIAWHIAQALKLKDPDRVVFHEITKGAVEAALNSPRKIDQNLVSAQEARRVIDRLVGYRLSPLLWRKVRTGLSAGRVQSVAVRLVVDREAEIDAFKPKESWSVEALLRHRDTDFRARLLGRKGEVKPKKGAKSESDEKFEVATGAEATEISSALGFNPDGTPGANAATFKVVGIESGETSRSGPMPYTTSTMQQDASTRLRMSPRRTMSVAQQLYEGVEVGTSGPTGLITYMRTDSTRISDIAKAEAVEHVTSNFGAQYVRSGAAGKAKASEGQNIQDAHEAVRPTDVSRTPDNMKEYLNPQQFKLYDLIWRRFVASQMSAAKFKNTRAEIEAGEYVLRASGSQLLFDGFQKVWKREDDKEKEKTPVLPELVVGDQPACSKLELEQHFTQPPPRYTEASLIKELEEQGIGRPSTYAPTIETIQERNYVRQEERRLHPTEVGKTVDLVLRQHFPDIVDVAFTADLEKRLDAIEEGSRQYAPTVRDWYKPFDETVVKAESTMERVKIPAKETGEACPECEIGQLVVREGKFGQFVGCSRYPECKYIKDRKTSTAEPTGEDCPDCGKPLVKRMGRRGPFIGCSGYPSCRYVRDDSSAKAAEGAQPEEPLGNCPECSKPLAHKRGRRGPFVGCTGYPSCTYIRPSASGSGSGQASGGGEPTGEDCPECGKPLVTRRGRFGPFVSCSGYPTCKYRPPKKVAAAS